MVTRSTAPGLLKPEDIGPLVVLPLQRESVALNPFISTTVLTDREVYRIPRITGLPTSAFVAEASPLPISDLTADEINVVPEKVAGTVPSSSEFEEDSIEGSMENIGAALVESARKSIDAAFLGALAAPNPPGLQSLANASGSGVQALPAGADWPKNLDWAARAASKIAGVGGRMTGVIMNPEDVLNLALLKDSSGSNRPLLATDPTQPGRRIVEGVPIIETAACPAGVAWAVDSSRVFTVVRRTVRVEQDRSVLRTTDRTLTVLTMRLAFGFADDRAVVRISKS